jgi:uncharacterized membrane protein YcgQ (UPF0703/DUF1980 family)
MKKHAFAMIIVQAALALITGCGKTSLPLNTQQNKAGTRSVILPGDFAADTAVNIPSIAADDAAASEDLPVIVLGNPKSAAADGPVIEIKEKLFIAQTNDVYLNPEDYMGKTIKLEGLFKFMQYEDADKSYCFVIRNGPGCCGYDGTAGFEVAWDQKTAPYPKEDDWVEAVGVLDSYEEDGYPYLYLALSSLTVKQERGAEFVTQ